MVDIPRLLTPKLGIAAFSVIAALLIPGCAAGPASKPAVAATDAGAADTGPADTSATDTKETDGGQIDGGPSDSTTSDSNASDSNASDSNASDSNASDSNADSIADSGADSDSTPDALLDGSANDVSGDISVPVDVPEVGDAGDTVDALSGPQPCSPTLALAPAVAKILPYDLRTLSASGGTGAYRFALAQNASGAVLNKYSGAYLSGSKSGVTDIIKVTDLGCVGSASSNVTVVEPLSMTPLEPWVDFKQVFKFAVANGSGSFTFDPVSLGRLRAERSVEMCGLQRWGVCGLKGA